MGLAIFQGIRVNWKAVIHVTFPTALVSLAEGRQFEPAHVYVWQSDGNTHSPPGTSNKYPATRNRTRDHLIAAEIYSQMLYQLIYSRSCTHNVPGILPMSATWSKAFGHDLHNAILNNPPWGLNPRPRGYRCSIVSIEVGGPWQISWSYANRTKAYGAPKKLNVLDGVGSKLCSLA